MLSILIFTTIYGQSCGDTNFEFKTQGAIDSFAINYPGCSIIEGSVEIHGSNITSLLGLLPIKEIKGDLYIHNIAGLNSIHGLDSIHTIGNWLRIQNIGSIEDFENINNLILVKRLSLSSLENIDSIIGFINLNWDSLLVLSIYGCTNLTWCSSDPICDFIQNENKYSLISNNGSGCKSITQVEFNCGIIDTLQCDTSLFQALSDYDCETGSRSCSLLDFVDPGTITGCFKLDQYNNGGFIICPEGGHTHNSKWFAFYAFCDSISIDLIPTFCFGINGNDPGIQAALVSWDTGECSSLSIADHYLDCRGIGPSMDPIYLRSGELEYGKLYYLVVDGWFGSVCDIEITINYACNPPPIGDWTDEMVGPDSICVGEYVEFQVTIPENGEYIEWKYKDSSSLVFGTSSHNLESSNNRCVIFESPGLYNVCAQPGGFCTDSGSELCKSVSVNLCNEVVPIDTTYLCPGDFVNIKKAPYSSPGSGSNYSFPGEWEIPIETAEGCDSIIKLIIASVENYPVWNSDMYKCNGDTVQVNGNFYTSQGEYSYLIEAIDSSRCDTIVYFQLIDNVIDIGIDAEINLIIPGDSLLLHGAIKDSIGNATLNYQWYDEFGALILFGPKEDSIYIHEAGTYCLKVESWTLDSTQICFDLDCITITIDSSSSTLNSHLSGKISFQPNPANETITLIFPNHLINDGEVNIQVFNALGVLMKDNRSTLHDNQLIIDSSQWPSGNFFIRCVSANGYIETGWVVVQH